MNNLVLGIGINDANYQVKHRIDGRQVTCPFYKVWASMLTRCYSEKFHKNNPSYVDCTVVKWWHYFMDFRDWMIEQDYYEKQLDKDILFPGNKIYSPNTCIFITAQINSLFSNCGTRINKHPIGVSKNKNGYNAQISMYGKLCHIGYFNSAVAAGQAYLIVKSRYVTEIAEKEHGKLKIALLDRAEKMMKQVQEM